MTSFIQLLLEKPPIEIALALSLFILACLLVWARLTVFTTSNRPSSFGSFLYDPVVALNLGISFYCFFASSYHNFIPKFVPLILYLCAGSLFIWAIRTTTSLRFALSEAPEELVTQGAFRFTRHPFYTSYILTWIASSILYSSLILSTTLIYLVAFYFYSAYREEQRMLEGKNGALYRLYQQRVGMFLPRTL